MQDGTTETNHGVINYTVVASVNWLDSLEPETRDQMVNIMNEVTLAHNAAVNDVDNAARQAISDSGVVVRDLTPEQNQASVDAMKPVWAKFVDAVGQENIDATQATNAKH